MIVEGDLYGFWFSNVLKMKGDIGDVLSVLIATIAYLGCY